MRRAALLLLLPFCVAAGPAERAHPGAHKPGKPQLHRAQATPQAAPSAPAALGARTDGFVAAPVPNQDMLAPVAPENRRAQVTPTMFRLSDDHHGDGYVYGSSQQGMDDARALTIPGVKLFVPLR